MDDVICNACNSIEFQELGVLGSLLWLRCRCCGLDKSIPAPKEDPIPDEEE